MDFFHFYHGLNLSQSVRAVVDVGAVADLIVVEGNTAFVYENLGLYVAPSLVSTRVKSVPQNVDSASL